MNTQAAAHVPAPAFPGGTIDIEGHELPMVLYKDRPVITFKMIDQVHERPDGTASRNFRQNRNRFIENEDFFRVPYEEHKNIPPLHNSSGGLDTGQRNPKIFLTSIGYMLLAKTLTDDLAWRVQRALGTTYFQTRHARTTNGQSKAMKAELANLKTHRAARKQAQEEAWLIYNGQGNLEDLSQWPILHDMTRQALEAYEQAPTAPEDGVVFRLDQLVAAYLAHLLGDAPAPPVIKFTINRDCTGLIRTVEFIARSRDLITAFDWLQDQQDIHNPFREPTTMAAALVKVFKKSHAPVPGWLFKTRIKSIQGLHYHWFEKSIDPETLNIKPVLKTD
ncbi:ORF6N domain-containing protein [Desulfobacter sp.]|uniref:ORF6N domain-containing protein n=1 Tax=Desulfobacter sp. TaxID=2294 RepID=UPI003D0E34D5